MTEQEFYTQAHQEIDEVEVPVNPDRLVDEEDFPHDFVQTEVDVGVETEETQVG